jgi:hypothetical protein
MINLEYYNIKDTFDNTIRLSNKTTSVYLKKFNFTNDNNQTIDLSSNKDHTIDRSNSNNSLYDPTNVLVDLNDKNDPNDLKNSDINIDTSSDINIDNSSDINIDNSSDINIDNSSDINIATSQIGLKKKTKKDNKNTTTSIMSQDNIFYNLESSPSSKNVEMISVIDILVIVFSVLICIFLFFYKNKSGKMILTILFIIINLLFILLTFIMKHNKNSYIIVAFNIIFTFIFAILFIIYYKKK